MQCERFGISGRELGDILWAKNNVEKLNLQDGYTVNLKDRALSKNRLDYEMHK